MLDQPKKILIVEDEVGLGKILVNKLNSSGFISFHEDDGEKGLKAAIEKKPDLILLDIMMPGMNGLEMLKELRADEWGKDVSVIIMTNLTDDAQFKEALNYGVYEYLVKSNWDLEDVVNKIRSTIEKDEAARTN